MAINIGTTFAVTRVVNVAATSLEVSVPQSAVRCVITASVDCLVGHKDAGATAQFPVPANTPFGGITVGAKAGMGVIEIFAATGNLADTAVMFEIE